MATLREKLYYCSRNSNCCVRTAVEITRSALGYKGGSCFELGLQSYKEILTKIGLAFPDHNLIAYFANSEDARLLATNVKYGGSDFEKDPDDESCIWIFGYTVKGETIGHMVIGYPVAYSGMIITKAFKIIL